MSKATGAFADHRNVAEVRQDPAMVPGHRDGSDKATAAVTLQERRGHSRLRNIALKNEAVAQALGSVGGIHAAPT